MEHFQWMDIAKLEEICDLAEKYDCMLLVDDSCTQLVSLDKNGRGNPLIMRSAEGGVDILTSTLGKAWW